MKKQLVIQSIPGRRHVDEGKRFMFKKCQWLIEIHYQVAEQMMECVELMPDQRISLLDAMAIIKDKAEDIIPDGDGECGYRVFRLK